MINEVTIGCVGLAGAGYHAATLISRASLRRREARALRGILLGDIEHGRRSANDPAVQEVLAWADRVVSSGQEVPLPVPRPRRPAPASAGPRRNGPRNPAIR